MKIIKTNFHLLLPLKKNVLECLSCLLGEQNIELESEKSNWVKNKNNLGLCFGISAHCKS